MKNKSPLPDKWLVLAYSVDSQEEISQNICHDVLEIHIWCAKTRFPIEKNALLPEPERIYDGREAILLDKKSLFGGGRTRDRGVRKSFAIPLG